jgi:alkyl hydroperoxide reductase subunit AhpF
MEKLIRDNVARQVKDVLSGMKQPVHLLLFTSKEQCEYCETTLQLLQEVTALSTLLTLSVFDLQEAAETASQYKVTGAPALVVAAQDGEAILDYGIRFLGIPAGHEFTALINDFVMVSTRDSNLSPATRAFLQTLKEPLLLQVFSTPT